MKTKFYLLSFFLLWGLNATSQEDSDSLRIKLAQAMQNGDYPKVDCILLQHEGELILEHYFNGFTRDSLHDTRSSFKSVTSLLTGIAIDQGLFLLEDQMRKFFPEWANDKRGDITVKDLLEMRSGLNCEQFLGAGPVCEMEMWETGDWIEYCLGLQLKDEPGLNWAYSSIEPMLVGEVIARASEMTIMAFAKQYLFEPLGIENYRWTISPKGRGMTAGSFYILPSGMLKIAEMVKAKGIWEGKTVVSKEWIEKSTDCEIDVEMSFTRFSKLANAKYTAADYGFYWYREKLQYGDIDTELLFASGNGGQYMMILEDYDAVVVFTGSNYGNWRGKFPFAILLKYLIPILEMEGE